MSAQGARKQTSSGNVVALDTRTRASKTTGFNQQTGGPTDGGDSWRDSVETRFAELRTDVRHLLIGGAVIALGLAAAGWGTYQAAMTQMRDIAVKQEQLSGKLDTMDARMTGKFEALGVRLDDQTKPKPDAKRN